MKRDCKYYNYGDRAPREYGAFCMESGEGRCLEEDTCDNCNKYFSISILSIDPGTYESAYVIIDVSTHKPIERKKVENEKLLRMLRDTEFYKYYGIKHFVVEMITGMGARVGDETFETTFWIGKFWEAAFENYDKREEMSFAKIYRRQEKTFLVGTQRCKDKDIIAALVNRYTPDQPNFGKGTAKDQGWFYGFRADIWSAYAVAVTYYHYYLTERGIEEREIAEEKRRQARIKRKSKRKR